MRGKENHMWNMDYIYELPLVVKIIILIVGLNIFLIDYWTGAKEKDIENGETEKPLDESPEVQLMTKCISPLRCL